MIKLFVLLFVSIFINSNFNAFFDREFYLAPLNKDWPHVPDPKFPKLPLEYLKSVDQTCQFLFYVGTLTWEVIPDQSIIKVIKFYAQNFEIFFAVFQWLQTSFTRFLPNQNVSI